MKRGARGIFCMSHLHFLIYSFLLTLEIGATRHSAQSKLFLLNVILLHGTLGWEGGAA